eukprot:TRINITY_DN1767_c0_g1_i1.p2 TRINITY_DN1767_c0_g1~~TRINITY_DN1767_c0_g1_i1.p2  ORF type:complete len:111 (-),score=19.11 TRINITY_DN1767_c0_g1_i1:76-408(-)
MMLDHQYKQAQEDLVEAFRLYQSLTNPGKAKEMLKYITICSILLHSTINIFHSQEAQQFQTDLEMINVQNLRYFYAVSYTHLTLPTKRIVQISVVAVSLKKKNDKKTCII